MFVNLTQHDIVIVHHAFGDITFPPSGTVCRVSTTETVVGEMFGIPTIRRSFGAVSGLEAFDNFIEGQVGIVSALVFEAVKNDPALWAAFKGRIAAPDTGPSAIRNDKGLVMKVTRLVSE